MRKLDHVGVIVRSLEDATKIYEQLGFAVERVVRVPLDDGREIPIAFIEIADGVDLELIEAPDFLDSGAEPLHHICFEVPDIVAELDRLKRAGTPLADEEPRKGVAAAKVAFLETGAADGVRIELAQKD